MGDLSAAINRKRFLYAFSIFYLFAVILAPYIKIGNRDNFEITFIFTLFFAALIPAAIRNYSIQSNRVLRVVLWILFSVLILDSVSIINYIRLNGFSNIAANIIPNIKVGLYLLLIAGFFCIETDDLMHESFLYRIIPTMAAIAGLIGIFQRFNLLNFNSWFTKYYIASYSGEVLIEVLKENQQWSRVLGTLSNPNFYGLEIIIFIIFIVSNIIFSDKIRDKFTNFLIALVLFTTLIFSQSRTALIVIVLIFIYIMLIQAVRGGFRNILKYLLISAGIVIITLLLIRFLHLNYLFDAIKNGAATRSVVQRIDRWKEAINLFKFHPIVGIGPVIGVYFPAVDNEYVHILRNYGILGLLGHMGFYVYVFIKSFKEMLSNENSIIVQHYAFAVNCSILAVLISNITLATFYHWRNFILLLFLCCMWAKSRRTYDYRKL